MIDVSRLSKFERNYIEKEEYFSKIYTEQRRKEKEDREKEKVYLASAQINMLLYENQMLVPGYSIILEKYTDIFSLLGDRERMEDFLNFLFGESMDKKLNGITPFFYHKQSKSYAFDFSYLIFMIMNWLMSLGVSKEEAEAYMDKFKPRKHGYNNANSFLIQKVFDVQHGLLATKFYSNSLKLKGRRNKQIYYNSSTVLYDGDKELFYKSIPILADKVLLYCSDEVIVRLLENRDNFELKQGLFGNIVLEMDEDLDHFFIFG